MPKNQEFEENENIAKRNFSNFVEFPTRHYKEPIFPRGLP